VHPKVHAHTLYVSVAECNLLLAGLDGVSLRIELRVAVVEVIPGERIDSITEQLD